MVCIKNFLIINETFFSIIPLDIEEEALLKQYLQKSDLENKCLYRKLVVRELQRKSHLKNFDIHNELNTKPCDDKTNSSKNFISCYGEGIKKSSQKVPAPILRIVNQNEELILKERISPFTGRKLKPYIRRDFEMTTPWLDLMVELKFVTGDAQNFERGPLDFCYVDAQHIPVINSLCEHFFWPGIDCKYIIISQHYPIHF